MNKPIHLEQVLVVHLLNAGASVLDGPITDADFTQIVPMPCALDAGCDDTQTCN